MPIWDVPFWFNGVFWFAGLSDLVNTGHPVLEGYSLYKQYILYGIGYFGFSAFSYVCTIHPILTIALRLIPVNKNHAIFTRDIPIIITCSYGMVHFGLMGYFGLAGLSDVIKMRHAI